MVLPCGNAGPSLCPVAMLWTFACVDRCLDTGQCSVTTIQTGSQAKKGGGRRADKGGGREKRGLLFVAGQVRQMHSATARQELMICRAVLMCELEKSRRANRSTTAIKLEVDRCNAALGFSLMSFGPELKPPLQPRSCHSSSRWPAIDEPARSLHPFWPRLCIWLVVWNIFYFSIYWE